MHGHYSLIPNMFAICMVTIPWYQICLQYAWSLFPDTKYVCNMHGHYSLIPNMFTICMVTIPWYQICLQYAWSLFPDTKYVCNKHGHYSLIPNMYVIVKGYYSLIPNMFAKCMVTLLWYQICLQYAWSLFPDTKYACKSEKSKKKQSCCDSCLTSRQTCGKFALNLQQIFIFYPNWYF